MAAQSATYLLNCSSSPDYSARSSLSGVSLRNASRVHLSQRCSARRVAVRAEVKYLSAQEAKEAVEGGGYRVVDVRDESQRRRASITGSMHVPLFVENTDGDLGTLIKKQAHTSFSGALYGLAFTKENTAFISTLQSAFSKDDKVLLVCQEGLRARTAVQKLEEAGFSSVAVLNKGLQSVPVGLFPKEGDRELRDAGKGGIVSVQREISIVLATILIGLIIFLQFNPQIAEGIFPQG